MGKMTLAIDFDGVMNSYTSGWIEGQPTLLPDPAVPGTFAFIKKAQESFKVVVHSSRLAYSMATSSMSNWCVQEAMAQGFSYREALLLVADLTFSIEKPPAFVTIDDRAIRFDGSWDGMLDKVVSFKPWNKR